MNVVFSFLLSAGPVALVAALIAVPVYYVLHRNPPEPRQPLSLARYLMACLVAGALGYGAGTMAGIFVACSLPDAGNLCGLVGVFGSGPLFAAVAVFVYAHRRVNRMRKAP